MPGFCIRCSGWRRHLNNFLTLLTERSKRRKPSYFKAVLICGSGVALPPNGGGKLSEKIMSELQEKTVLDILENLLNAGATISAIEGKKVVLNNGVISHLNVVHENEPEPKTEPHICDLMPIGDTFCGLEVAGHDAKSNLSIGFKREDSPEWIWDSTARAIYESEMELRELRRMKPVVEAAKKNVEIIEKSFGRSTEHLFGDEVNNLIKSIREYADNE